MSSALLLENTELKKRSQDLEIKNMELSEMIKNNMGG